MTATVRTLDVARGRAAIPLQNPTVRGGKTVVFLENRAPTPRPQPGLGADQQ